MTLRAKLCLLVLPVALTIASRSAAQQEGAASCAVGSAESAAISSATNLKFHYYKVPFLRGQRANRDFEFLWSDTYRNRYARDLDDDAGADNLSDLDRLGRTICDTPRENPFGIDQTDIAITYNLLAQRRTPNAAQRDTIYNSNPNELIGFRVAQNFPDLEENHIDAYIYTPDHGLNAGWAAYVGDQAIYNLLPNSKRGRFPADFNWFAVEDSAAGHANSQAYVLNSVSIAGPPPWKIGSQEATPWTRPSGVANTNLIHESLHAINDDRGSDDDRGTVLFLHLFARAAEILTGPAVDRETFELDYTASLWPDDSSEPNAYPNWLSFAAYLAFNYRGADTTAAHYEDDLIRRWATRRGSNKLAGLAGRLKDQECPECNSYPEFVGRDSVARLQRLIHNWRVANWVNNSSLPGGRYGYPAGYGFSPNYQLRAWESFDGVATDDTVSVPPVSTLGPANRNQLLRFTERPGAGGSAPRRLELDMFGAEYWVFKADPSLQSTQQDLSVRVRASKLMVGSYSGSDVNWNVCQRADYSGRLTVSIVAYSVASDDLYLHPEWATGVTTQEVVLDQPNQDIVLSVPSFGGTTKAAVVVVTLGDGPEGTYALGNWPPKLPGQPRTYPIELMVMAVANDLPTDPFALAATPRVETSPAWSPAGDSLAFEGIDASGHRGIFVAASLQGVGSRPLVAANFAQYDPAWSPRDRSIAYTQAGAGRRDLWRMPPSGPAQQLTSMPGVIHDPAFSPNGEKIAYVRCVRTYPPAEDTTLIVPPGQWTWSSEIRLRTLSTSEDIVFTSLPGDSTITNVRWSPDGKRLFFRAIGQDGVWHLWRVALTGSSAWIQSDSLAPIALEFDLAPGVGKMLVTNAGEAQWEPICTLMLNGCPPCGSGQSFTYPVLGLRDTLSGTVTGIAQEVAFPVADARWSPDGTRVALTIAQAGNPDIHVVKTTLDRAPAFTSSNTYYLALACEPFNLPLSATDADNDPITREVFDLPAGAVLQGDGTFHWEYPVVGHHWFIARALDPQGAVASKVIHLEVWDQGTCGGGGGEGGEDPPILPGGGHSVRPAESSRMFGGPDAPRAVNTFLDGAPSGEWVAQTARLVAARVDTAGHVRSQFVALRPGLLKLDRARLMVVDHAPGTVAVATTGGIAVGPKRRPAHLIASTGADLSGALLGGEDHAKLFTAGMTVTVAWNAADSVSGLFADCARASAASLSAEWGVRIEAQEDGAWHTVGRIHPRSGYDALAVPLEDDSPLRLVFMSDTYVRELAGYSMTGSSGEGNTVTVIEVSATDMEGGVERLADTDSAAIELGRGQRVMLEFDGPSPVAELRRTLFLDLVASFTPEGSAGATGSRATESLPTRFALHRNQPNPFGGGTTIRFDVPRPAAIRIDVFDAMGRRVRTLADRQFEPGSHGVAWDGTDASGQRARPGVYLYRMTAEGFRDQGRMVLLGR